MSLPWQEVVFRESTCSGRVYERNVAQHVVGILALACAARQQGADWSCTGLGALEEHDGLDLFDRLRLASLSTTRDVAAHGFFSGPVGEHASPN